MTSFKVDSFDVTDEEVASPLGRGVEPDKITPVLDGDGSCYLRLTVQKEMRQAHDLVNADDLMIIV